MADTEPRRINPRYLCVLTTALRSVVTVLGLGALALGVLLVFSGPDRWSAPAFAGFRATPGGLQLWGWLCVAVGAAQLAANRLHTDWRGWLWESAAHVAAAVLSFSFTIVFMVAAFKSPNASVSGIPTYLSIALIHMVLANSFATIARVERNSAPRACG